MLSEHELGQFFAGHFRKVAARLEVRDHYDVDAERGELEAYLAGEPAPGSNAAWLDQLRADAAAGKRWQWVHVVRGPLSPYLRMAFEWGYAANVRAGAEVRVLDLAEHPRPDGLIDEDFWLFDDGAVLVMIYDAQGRFLGAEPAEDDGRYRRALQVAWLAAEPLSQYWRVHTQYHRQAA